MSKIIIYQLLPRLFGNSNANCVPNGTIEQNGCGKFNDITPKALHAIRNTGATHVWYTGVIEHTTRTDYSKYGIPADHPAIVKGEAGSPYAIKDYYDNDPDLAVNVEKRREEFKELIDRTHKAGLKVIMDFIPNHVARHYHSDCTPKGTYSFGEHDDKNVFYVGHNNFYYLGNSSYGCNLDAKDCADEEYSETPLRATGNDCFGSPGRNDWYDTVKLNYGIDYRTGNRCFSPVPDTWVKMLKILRYWAAMGVDGFRCDMVEMTPVEFWHWAVAKIKEEFPGIIFIGEIYQPHIYRSFIKEGHFDYLYDKVGLYDTLRAVMNGQTSANDISYALQSTSDIRGNMLTFLENHDEQRIASDFFAAKAERALAALIVSATTGTEPFMLYAGQEFGERGMDKEGYSGVDGRTTIFDYWSVDTLRRWKGNGDYSGEQLTEQEKNLQAFYSHLLNLCNKEKALAEGLFYGIQYANPHSEQYDSNHIFSYLRGKDDELMLIVTNFSENDKECAVTVPEEAFAYFGVTYSNEIQSVKELLSGKSIDVTFNPFDKTIITVPANSGVILKFKL